MSDAQMKIQIGADVQGAVSGLNQVAQATNKTTTALAKLPNSSAQATNALGNLSRVAQDAPYGFIGIANNINPLLESFQRLKVSTGSTGGALKALGKELTGGAGLGLAVGVVSSLLVVFGDKLFGASKAAKEADERAKDFKNSVDGIFKSVAKEATEVGSLIVVLKDETTTRERRLAAIKELQKIQPDIFKGLKLEGDAVKGLDAAYMAYMANLKNVIAAKMIQAQIESKLEQLLRMQGATAVGVTKVLLDGTKKFEDRLIQGARKDPGLGGGLLVESILGKREERDKAINQIQSDLKELFENLSKFSKDIKVNVDKVKVKPKKVEIERVKSVEAKDLLQVEDKDFSIKFPKIKFERNNMGMETTLFKINEQLTPIREKLKGLISLGQSLGSTLSNAFGNIFDSIAQGENVFKAIGNAVKSLVLDLIKTAIQTLIVRAVMNAFLPGSASAVSASGLGSIGGILAGFRAGGGPVSAGRAYMVGENRPEMFIPETSGRIVPAMSGNIGAGQMSVNFIGTGRASGRDLVFVFEQEMKSQGRNK